MALVNPLGPLNLEATQADVKTAVQAINTKTPALGQAAMAASQPVVIANNQSAVPVTGTFFQATQPVSGTVTANTGTSGMAIYTDSSTNLGAAGVFTGTSRDAGSTAGYNYFIANVQANQAGTIRIEKSTDNTNWRRASKDIAVSANAPEEVTVKVTTRYNRVVYTNGGVAQTEFLLTSAYHRN